LNNDSKIVSLPPIIDNQSKVLILGSIPSVESLKKQEYYGNKRNHFWTILFTIFQKDPSEDYTEKLSCLKQHHIALWDVIHSCLRAGSLDSNIQKEQPNDLIDLLNQFPNIKFIGFNGGKSYEVFKKHIGLEAIHPVHFMKLPSTSPVPGKNVKSLEQKIEDWKIIQNYTT